MKKGVLLLIMLFISALIFADYLMAPEPPSRTKKAGVSFLHALHGDSLGLSCEMCHAGSMVGQRAYMPSKQDCMDCHRLPLTESEGIVALDSSLKKAPDYPWSVKSRLPAHVVFHHGVHAKANVSCEVCHSNESDWDRGVPPSVSMNECLACHRGEKGFPPAATDCASCHR
ncbi:MAG TPA: hypothetical protein GX724_08590 [Fibrobacter sp.]|nr:hypothetical protein [Fibrobacter sp.]